MNLPPPKGRCEGPGQGNNHRAADVQLGFGVEFLVHFHGKTSHLRAVLPARQQRLPAASALRPSLSCGNCILPPTPRRPPLCGVSIAHTSARASSPTGERGLKPVGGIEAWAQRGCPGGLSVPIAAWWSPYPDCHGSDSGQGCDGPIDVVRSKEGAQAEAHGATL